MPAFQCPVFAILSFFAYHPIRCMYQAFKFYISKFHYLYLPPHFARFVNFCSQIPHSKQFKRRLLASWITIENYKTYVPNLEAPTDSERHIQILN
jgi:hypothetical protein